MKKSETHFIVQSASARTGARFGEYRRVAVLEVLVGVRSASMISERSRDVVRVVDTWERLNVGKTPKCAYGRALEEAESLAGELNAETLVVAPAGKRAGPSA